jgi:hypothetical protein
VTARERLDEAEEGQARFGQLRGGPISRRPRGAPLPVPADGQPASVREPLHGGGRGPVSWQVVYRLFTSIGAVPSEQRIARLLAEAGTCPGDAIRLARFFGLSRLTAMRYADADAGRAP